MKSVLGRCVVAAVLCGIPAAAAAPAGAEAPPNIVLIVTDDGPLAGELQYLPRLREMLFDPGITLDTFLTPNPMCCPSRSSTLRGQYCHNTGVLGNQGFKVVYRKGLEAEMLPVWLERAGYATALFGKYLNGYLKPKGPAPLEYVPPGWTEWYGGVPRNGYGFSLNENGRVVEYPVDGPHANDVLGGHAVDFIRRRAPEGPVFLLISTGSPHKPAVPARRHRFFFWDTPLPVRPNFNEQNLADKPAWVRALRRVRADAPARLRLFRQRLRAMLSVEDLVADVFAELEAQGVMGNTYVFYFVDNGWHFGEHRIADKKGTAYEESVVVPAAVRGPGIPAGQHRSHLVANHDLTPTILELAGAEPPAFFDGRSLLPLLSANPPAPEAWRRALSLRKADPGQSPGFHGLRLRDAKYVLLDTGEEEYYDLATDPFELRSLHERPSLAPTLALVRRWSRALGACAADTCRALEMAPP